MSFFEQPPSKQWATLKYRGTDFAQVWFKPEGEPLGVTFRIARENFQIPGLTKDLTLENLLKAVAIAPQTLASWRYGDIFHACMDGAAPDLMNPLPPPPPDVTHLEILVRVKPASDTAATATPEPDVSKAQWHDLEKLWKAILGIEATMDTLRITMQGLLVQMEGSLKTMLSVEEKTYALRADVAQWEKAKSRVHFALPKLKDIIHRAVWALGSPERKRLGQLYDDNIEPQILFPGMTGVLKQLEDLLKDRQVLSTHANMVFQECKSVAADVQGTLRTLQNNAAINAKNKRGDSGGKGGKFFKQVRRWSGA